MLAHTLPAAVHRRVGYPAMREASMVAFAKSWRRE
jgi:hypothetical protein